jgi:membrane protein YqaA with SNARE-associated domain
LLEDWAGSLEEWMRQFAVQFGYLGVFVISFIGSVSVVFPVPYTIIIPFLGTILDPFFVAVSGGLGSALGEFSGYVLGYTGRAVVSEERRRKMEFMVKLFDKYGPVSIFLFALTPLPDDLLFIPLGIMHYPFLRAFIPALLGKMLMTFVLAYVGQQYFDLIEALFGGSGLIGIIISVVLLIVIIVAMIKIDWEKLFEERVNSNKGD